MAISVVQQSLATAFSVSATQSRTLNGLVAGNLLVARGFVGGDNSTITFSDSGGNTWTTVISGNWGSTARQTIAYLVLPLSGDLTVTMTMPLSRSSGIDLIELSGVDTTTVVSGSQLANFGSVTSSTGPVVSGVVGGLRIAAIGRTATSYGYASPTPEEGGFTPFSAAISGSHMFSKVIASTGDEAFSVGFAASSSGTQIHVAFNPDAAADVTAPTVSSATINAAGTTLTVVFDEVVSGDGTGFVLDDATGLTYVTGSGTDTLTFTIASTIYSGETRTLEYSSVTGNIADTSANDLATFTGQAITNNSSQVLDVTAPTLSSATVTAATVLTLVFDEAVNITTATGLTMAASGAAVTISSPTGTGTSTLTFTLSRSIASTESLSFSYDSGTGDIADLAANALASITGRLVTNNINNTPGSVSLIGPGLIQ